MKKTISIAVLFILLLVGVAFAGATAPMDDPIGVLGGLVDAVRSGQWRLVAALLLSLIMLGMTRMRTKIKWFRGDRGGAVLVMLVSLCGALSTSLLTEAPIDFKMMLGAVGTTFTAVGGYTWIRRLLWPVKQQGIVVESKN